MMTGPRANPFEPGAPVVAAREARQAQPGMGVRYVLVISTAAAAALMGLIYLVFFAT